MAIVISLGGAVVANADVIRVDSNATYFALPHCGGATAILCDSSSNCQIQFANVKNCELITLRDNDNYAGRLLPLRSELKLDQNLASIFEPMIEVRSADGAVADQVVYKTSYPMPPAICGYGGYGIEFPCNDPEYPNGASH